MIRLFVALALPEPVRQQLAMLFGGVPGAKWSKPENLHLTLRFIGSVDGRLYGDIVDALSHVRAPAFELQLEGVGQFGDKRRVESLWAGAKPCEPLQRLQGKVETVLQRLGLEPERRKYHPHVTLARLKAAPEHRVAGYLAQHAAFQSSRFEVRDFVLFSSFLARTGAIYQPEATVPLLSAA